MCCTIRSFKNKGCPLNTQTIPRLELLAALLSRLLSSVASAPGPELVLGEPVCYTDSKIARFWIRGYGMEWRQFVQNCVNEIRSLIPTKYWHHCSGETNLADLPSRGVDLSELTESTLWFRIPHHIYEPEKL